MEKYIVNASLLNLRSSPSTANNGNILTRLKNQEVVELLEQPADSNWLKVRSVSNPALQGFAFAQYLKLQADSTPVEKTGFLKPVHLKPNPLSRRNNHAAWPFPLGEPDLQFSKPDSGNRKNELHAIVNYLSVNTSARYHKDEHTYCNIYAYDYCYLAGVFLPRVWWRAKALLDLQAGKEVAPIYDNTVDEINANSLFTWLGEWGNDYGWSRTFDLDELQAKVNTGKVGVICGPNINPRRSGHIACVVPETDDKLAMRQNGKVVCPLLSQAGATNLRYYNNNRWWLLPQIKEFGFWYL